MKWTTKPLLLVAALVPILAAGSLRAQTHVDISVPLFSEDFSGYEPGATPATVANGGLWATATWTQPAGSYAVVEDADDVFGQGVANRFLRMTSSYGATLVTPVFLPQEVVSFSFDFIGRFHVGTDGNRWLNGDPRAATLAAQTTSMRMSNGTIRTAATDAPPNPSYGGNDVPVRILTIVNNRDDTISYDRPDGLGTATLSSALSSIWIYHYTGPNAETWEHLIPEYAFARNAGIALGPVIDNLRFLVDSTATLRSFDLDNIEVLGSIAPLPPVYVTTPHLLFSEDFNRYEPGTPPTTTEFGGLWATATWNGTTGFWGVVADDEDAFGEGMENRFFRLVSTHNLNPGLITPDFEPQEVVVYAFDFIGRVHEIDGNRWVNVDVRDGTMAAHVTSARMFNATLRSDTLNPFYGGNNLRIRIVTIMNNRVEPIIYDRPDGLGTAEVGSARASVWLHHSISDTWENIFPEYVFARNASITTGAVINNLRVFMDSNELLRSCDIDNITVHGSIPPAAAAIVLSASAVGENIELRWHGLAGKTYQVEYRASLSAGSWLDLGAEITPDFDGEQLAIDSLANDQRYYQVREVAVGP